MSKQNPKTHPPTRRVSDDERRSVGLHIRVTTNDRERLHAAAAARGVTVSDLIRQLVDHDEQRSAA